MNQKEFRRMVGFVAVWLQRLGFDRVLDPRNARGQRWQLKTVLSACLLGLMAGGKSLADVEQLTDNLSRSVRRKFGVPRRLADTTMRDVLCRLEWTSLVDAFNRAVAMAHRGKMLQPMTLPFEMLAMDGKATALPCWDDSYAQKHQPEGQLPYGLMRTVTATLVTARGKPCITVSPIPASTNEMGHFQKALKQACAAYPSVTLVSYDQGANSEENAQAVLALGKHYLFRLNDERRHMQQLATELLATKDVVVSTEDVISNREQHIRRLRLFRLTPSGLPVVYKNELWEHARTLLCVESERHQDRCVVTQEKRYFASSLATDALTPAQWLWATRGHWAVETTHQVLDVAFAEDTHPWIVNDANGMLVVAVLRRIAYTLLTLYRSVRQRSDEKRLTTWRALMSRMRDMLIASTEATLLALRPRKSLSLFAIAAA
jgi:hypothetical protein